MEKTAVFNLIILDESGSMSNCKAATISGCNETINVAKTLQEKHGDQQKSFLSIYAFQSDGKRPSRYICKNVATEQAENITDKDYEPWGCTPLLDAVGSTLVDLEMVASTHDDAMGIVTIITDGYENSSKQYTLAMVRTLISRLKEKGWTFNFIGANIDVDKIGEALSIDNRMAFTNDADGTKDMFESFSNAMVAEAGIRYCEEVDMNMAEKIARRKKASTSFFSRKK